MTPGTADSWQYGRAPRQEHLERALLVHGAGDGLVAGQVRTRMNNGLADARVGLRDVHVYSLWPESRC